MKCILIGNSIAQSSITGRSVRTQDFSTGINHLYQNKRFQILTLIVPRLTFRKLFEQPSSEAVDSCRSPFTVKCLEKLKSRYLLFPYDKLLSEPFNHPVQFSRNISTTTMNLPRNDVFLIINYQCEAQYILKYLKVFSSAALSL